MKTIAIGDTVLYNDKRVLVRHINRVAGGTVVWVTKSPDESDWPWAVTSFTTTLEELTSCPDPTPK